ncbi:MAG: asparagine synthase, partial [Burkholderiaceae bacterium]|nr:asparagine synthase [Burkholderiaceae bacterium]
MQTSTSATDFTLSSGSPRFSTPQLQALASEHGSLKSWQHAFATDGPQAAAKVAGDFAVGFNTPTGGVYLAIDRFAIRSLCYRIVDGQMRFAARADDLADASTDIDPQAIFDYLYFHAIPSPRTIFKGIHRLPPGHYALFENGQLLVKPYWTPQFNEQGGRSFDALRAEFRQLLRDSVTTELAGHKPACFLSGGTDSSTIAGMAREVTGMAPASYSIGFEAEGYDEMAYARLAAKHFGTDHHEYYVTPADLVASIPDVAAYYDQPFGNSSAVPAFYCARMAKQDGHD